MILFYKLITLSLQPHILIFTHIMSIFRIYKNKWIIHFYNSFREKKKVIFLSQRHEIEISKFAVFLLTCLSLSS